MSRPVRLGGVWRRARPGLVVGAGVRCGLGGTALGLATLAAFSFVGVPAVQPPAAALLTVADLPPGYTPEAPLTGPAVGGACAALLADPAPGAVSRRFRQAGTGATVWEAVARPPGDLLDDLRSRLDACAFTVEPRSWAGTWAGPARRRSADGFTVDLPNGYLAAARVGGTVVVLRCAGAGPAILDAAVDKLTASRPAGAPAHRPAR